MLWSSSSQTRGPETDMSQPGIEPGPLRWKASTLAKNYSNSVLIAIWNIQIRARGYVFKIIRKTIITVPVFNYKN
jgi:hypothetical protein